jgi:signal transduction histidine kinase
MVADDRRTRRAGWALWTGSVRARTTGAAVVVVAVVLAIGAVALVVSLRSALTREVRTAAEVRAEQAVSALESGRAAREVAAATGDDQFLQVVDGADVVAASRSVADSPAVAELEPGDSAEVTLPFDDDEFIVVADTADTSRGQLTVLVGRSLDRVTESSQAVTGLLAVGLPLLLVVLAGAIWRLVGRALAPVDAVRREVDAISASELHRRVPEPPGTDEIARLTATMNRMLARLQVAQDDQRRFVSDASHELRSPIAAIRQHAELAVAHPDTTTTADLGATVSAECLRLQALVDDLMLLAAADEHALRLQARPLDLDDLVFDEARRLRANTRLRIDTTEVSAGRVEADAVAARRVVRNLADNAARHARSQVHLRLAERDGWVVLDVDDDGPGIGADERARVFERFVRLDDARARDAGGAGLGLAIVAELVTAQGGDVSVAESTLGGARFTVRLPGYGAGVG